MDSRKMKFLVGGLIVVCAIGYLAFTGVQDTMVYYFTPTELLAKGSSIYSEGVRVSGKVEENSIEKDEVALTLKFNIKDNKNSVSVLYEGVVPDMFDEGRSVVAEGFFTPEGVFKASSLLVGCPSKYEAKVEQKT